MSDLHNLPKPWIRVASSHTDKPEWYNPEDKTTIKFTKRKWELSVNRTFRKNGVQFCIDEIFDTFSSFDTAWKAYNWMNGYKI